MTGPVSQAYCLLTRQSVTMKWQWWNAKRLSPWKTPLQKCKQIYSYLGQIPKSSHFTMLAVDMIQFDINF